MIVYGDREYDTLLHDLLARAQAIVSGLLSMPPGEHLPLDDLRTLVVLLGQIEQGVTDAATRQSTHFAAALPDEVGAMTDLAADALYVRWVEGNGEALSLEREPHESLRALGERLQSLSASAGETRVPLKLPEGMAFYALYPEQYFLSALAWVSEHPVAEGEVAVVVGILSAGTSLSAAVAAALRAHGLITRRLVLRPGGHPFSREAHIARDEVRGADWGLVVDEGPGLSGSSMAAVGEALVLAGLTEAKIAFLPGHERGPGASGSDAVKRWWQRTPSYAASIKGLRFDGLTLSEALARWLEERKPVHMVAIDEIGWGWWRKLTFPARSDWPALALPFERTKYLLTTAAGERFLFKFEGLVALPDGRTTAEAAYHELVARAERGWGPSPIGVAFGFVCLPWVEGMSLTQRDFDADTVERIAGYIFYAAGPPLDAGEQRKSVSRLGEMLYWNTWEALGEELAERTRGWSAAVLREQPSARSYGDGHLSPYEWLCTPDGKLVKVDSAGHTWDHTVVGRQSAAWDLAGAAVEWELDESYGNLLLDAYREAGGEDVSMHVLRLYMMAYAAFRAGLFRLCHDMTAHDDPDLTTMEKERVWKAYERYSDKLRTLLAEATPA